MAALVNKALEVLARKFATADRTKRRFQQIAILEKMATIALSANNAGLDAWSVELHWDIVKLSLQQSHIEFWDNHQGQLVPNKWYGVMSHLKDQDGDWICDWAQTSGTSTLEQAINHAPEWFGGQIAAQSLNLSQLVTLVAEVLA